MPDEYVIYNGVEMAAEWPEKIEEAQRQSTYVTNGLNKTSHE